MNKVRLELIGITYNQIESGVYAVILQQEGGTRRIPIIIGFPEAQAIECKLQEVVTPRPLTHDLMINIMESFGLALQEVYIYKMPNGVFAAELTVGNGIETNRIDSRSSDAIALAIRAGAPIYTSEEVLEDAGFDANENNEKRLKSKERGGKGESLPDQTSALSADLSSRTIEQLKEDMQKAAESEDYEKAAKIKAEIEKRENPSKE